MTIPKEIRRILGIREGGKVLFEIWGNEIKIRKLKNFLEFEGSLKGKILSPDEIRDRVEEEVAKDAV